MTDQERVFTSSNVGELPLIVVVALDANDVFAPWQRAALLTSSAAGILRVGQPWLSRMLRRKLRRRYRAERVLSELAATDAPDLPGQPPHRGRAPASGVEPCPALD